MECIVVSNSPDTDSQPQHDQRRNAHRAVHGTAHESVKVPN